MSSRDKSEFPDDLSRVLVDAVLRHDADGLRDGDEATKYHTDPCNPDTDADGLRDGNEVNKYLTDPLNADTDGDGVWDGAEILKHKTNPLNPDTQSPQTDSHAESAEGL